MDNMNGRLIAYSCVRNTVPNFLEPNRVLEDFLLNAAFAWGSLLTVITEGLSIFRLLTQAWIAGAWALISLILCLRLYWSRWQSAVQNARGQMEGLARPGS